MRTQSIVVFIVTLICTLAAMGQDQSTVNAPSAFSFIRDTSFENAANITAADNDRVADADLQATPLVTDPALTTDGELDQNVEAPDMTCGGETRTPRDVKNKTLDCRGSTIFSFYSGMVIDTFAANELIKAQQLHGDSEVKQAPIAGIDFQHRIMRWGTDEKQGSLWVFGETIHSKRSAETVCGKLSEEEQADRPECADPTPSDPNTPDPDLASTIIRDSTALEAYVGLRWEPAIQKLIDEGARGYVVAQAGFLTVAGKGSDIIDNHHIGVGILKSHGAFTDSFFEIGVGRTDLFKKNDHRIKINGLMSYNMKWPKESFIRPFLQLTVDSDLGDGADSVQTFLGFDFDFTQLRINTRAQPAE